MIVSMRHGRVPSAKAAAYRAFLNERAIPDYASVPRSVSVHILERAEGDVTHFVTMTFWTGIGAIRAFAGADVTKAKYYPEDAEFLLEYEPEVVHYDVVGGLAAYFVLGKSTPGRLRSGSSPPRPCYGLFFP